MFYVNQNVSVILRTLHRITASTKKNLIIEPTVFKHSEMTLSLYGRTDQCGYIRLFYSCTTR